MAKQTVISIETQSLLILRGTTKQAWCPLCAAEVEMIALQNLGTISSSGQALENWFQSGVLHRSDMADGSGVICLNSLLARVQNSKTTSRR